MNTKPVAQAEAKAVWDSLENPSPRKVAEKLDAAGQPVDCGIIAEWERDGWPGALVAEVTPPEPKKAEPETEEPKKAEQERAESMKSELVKAEPPGRRRYARRAEDVLFKVIATSESLLDSIRDITTAVPGDCAAAIEDARPAPLLKAADSVAKLIKASSEAANMAIEGLQRIPALRVDDAAAAPGAQVGQSSRADKDYPLRDSMEAYDAELKRLEDEES